MCSDLGIKVKVVNYLIFIFIKVVIEKGFKDYYFIVLKGKFVVLVGDGDNFLNWKKLIVKLIFKKGGIVIYEFIVFILDGLFLVKWKVIFVKENKKWKVN